jgi:hypothetical protein
MLAGVVAQDGGVAVPDLTLQLPTEKWSQITREFFLTGLRLPPPKIT